MSRTERTTRVAELQRTIRSCSRMLQAETSRPMQNAAFICDIDRRRTAATTELNGLLQG